jgi:hypothetical protein
VLEEDKTDDGWWLSLSLSFFLGNHQLLLVPSSISDLIIEEACHQIIISSGDQYVTLQKYFSYPSFSYFTFFQLHP